MPARLLAMALLALAIITVFDALSATALSAPRGGDTGDYYSSWRISVLGRYTQSLGVQKYYEYTTFGLPTVVSTVPVTLKYGDVREFRSPVPVTVKWDGFALALVLTVWHETEIRDDKGRVILRVMDAAAGSTYYKGSEYCDVGLGVCRKYYVVVDFEKYVTLENMIQQRYVLHVKASTAYEAKMKASLIAGILGEVVSVSVTGRIEQYYVVETIVTVKVGLDYVVLNGKIVEETYFVKTGEKHAETKPFKMTADTCICVRI